METGEIIRQARRLQAALQRQGVAGSDRSVLEEVVARLRDQAAGQAPSGERPPSRGEAEDQPLAELDAALRQHGITLEVAALAEAAWAMLGVPAARSVRLGTTARARLSHLAELHDLAFPSGARTLARQLAGEVNLAPDLLRARPWLTGAGLEKLEDVLGAIFNTEWSGFLALLGEFGPWVYVPSVADLQALSHRYAALVQLAAGSRDADVLAAAWRLQQPGPGASLLARLEVTDHRQRREDHGPPWATREATAALVSAERAFWQAAELQAQRRRDEWAARRKGPGGTGPT